MAIRRNDAAKLGFLRQDFIDEAGFDAHAAWAASAWPSVAAAFESTPQGPFYSYAMSVVLDGVVVQFATGSARALARSAERLAVDGHAMLVVGVNVDGPTAGEARGRTLHVAAGQLLLLDLAQPSTVRISAGRSVQLAVPRALAEEYLGPVRKLHGRIVTAAPAALLLAYLEQFRESIPTLAVAQDRRLAGVLLDLLAVAVSGTDRGRRVEDGASARPAASIRAGIEASLTQPAMTIDALCRKLGVSRSTLSRTFREEGGVEAHLRHLRLARVRDALLDPGNGERIAALAERWGFCNASHLNRAFRARYGVTPGAMRRTAPPPS